MEAGAEVEAEDVIILETIRGMYSCIQFIIYPLCILISPPAVDLLKLRLSTNP